jgi:uncharacterized protein YcbK (DUF882 family)
MLAAGGCLFPRALRAALDGSITPERSLGFFSINTNESIDTVYWSEGCYVPESLSRINYIMRDYRTGDVMPIETALIDLLFALRDSLGSSEPVHVVSGYRSPLTNERLRETAGGIARKSLHMEGRAADIRLPGCSLNTLYKAAVALQAGGAGYYPESGFVHVDTGSVRAW